MLLSAKITLLFHVTCRVFLTACVIVVPFRPLSPVRVQLALKDIVGCFLSACVIIFPFRPP
jgi:hypothetical protein